MVCAPCIRGLNNLVLEDIQEALRYAAEAPQEWALPAEVEI